MDWWIWVLIIVASVVLVIDFFIIGGIDPRDWKGGGKRK